MKWMILASAIIAGLVTLAWADDDSDRRKYIDDIEDNLERAASELQSVPRASSPRDIQDALGYVNKVDDLLDKLKSVQGSDSKARDMVSKYPRFVSEFKSAAQKLTKLKKQHHALDKLPKLCEQATERFEKEIERYVKQKDAAGVEKLPAFAKSVGRPLAKQWTSAEKSRRELDRARSDVKRFSASHGKWKDVRRTLHQAADTIWDDWEDQYKNAGKECKDWADWSDHPLLDKALKKLVNTGKERARLIKRLDKHVKELSGMVRDVHRSSSWKLARPSGKARTIRDNLAKLRPFVGTNRRAKQMVEIWPRHLDAFHKAARAVSALKRKQNKIDELAKRCEGWERQVVSQAKSYASAKDLEGLGKTSEQANEYGKKVKKALRKADADRATLQRLKDDARRFSVGDDSWRTVSENLKSSANGIFGHFQTMHAKAHKACDELAKGSKHKVIVQFRKSLKKTQNKLADFRAAASKKGCEAIPYGRLRGACKGLQGRKDSACKNFSCSLDNVKKRIERFKEAKKNHYEASRRDNHEAARSLEKNIAKMSQELKAIKADAQKRVPRAEACRRARKSVQTLFSNALTRVQAERARSLQRYVRILEAHYLQGATKHVNPLKEAEAARKNCETVIAEIDALNLR